MKITLINGEVVNLFKGRYSNMRPALFAKTDEGFPSGVLSINVPELDLAPDEIVIKTYSEGALLNYVKALSDVEVIDDQVLYWVEIGYVRVPVFKAHLENVPEGSY